MARKDELDAVLSQYAAAQGEDSRAPLALTPEQEEAFSHEEAIAVVESPILLPANGASYTKEEVAVRRASAAQTRVDLKEAVAVERNVVAQGSAETVGTDEETIPDDPGVVIVSQGRNPEALLTTATKTVTLALSNRQHPVAAFEGALWTGRDIVTAIGALRRGFRMYQRELSRKRPE